jgi:hypothetical protein
VPTSTGGPAFDVGTPDGSVSTAGAWTIDEATAMATEPTGCPSSESDTPGAATPTATGGPPSEAGTTGDAVSTPTGGFTSVGGASSGWAPDGSPFAAGVWTTDEATATATELADCPSSDCCTAGAATRSCTGDPPSDAGTAGDSGGAGIGEPASGADIPDS